MEKILIFDFGSQYTQLIARRIRELNVYCEIHPFNHVPAIDSSIKGIILSGSPCSVRDSEAPTMDLSFSVPMLGICYGAQLMAHAAGGQVMPSKIREYGRSTLTLKKNHPLWQDVNEQSTVWMSHADTIFSLPDGFTTIATTENIPIAAYQAPQANRFGIQFHPEVTHSEEGKKILKNFIVNICGCKQDWTPSHFIDDTLRELKEKLKNDKVVMGLSGGVDSTVAAMLLHRAIGKNLYCIFVDNGLLRKNEFNDVQHLYRDIGLQLIAVDAKEAFYNSLKNLTEPEAKRKAIGKTFIEIFDQEAHKIQNVQWLGQGTIYPDVIESVSVKGPSATIKSHHNVGGLPEKMKLKIVEPLRSLFKDEVRQVGKSLGISDSLLLRHPFPGPGLGIRVLGEITAEKVCLLQEADAIFIAALREKKLYNEVWQAGAILLPVQSVGVMGDERTYEQVVALRAVKSVDGMTADWAPLPYDALSDISNAIINQVKGINRVVYDISSKPPATIEWE